MHLNFPHSKGFYSLEELKHLIKALGFPHDLIEKNLPKSMLENKSLSLKTLLDACDDRYFNQDLHYTVNMKPGNYNVESLKKCLQEVSAKLFSFPDVERIRLAFEMYEDFDQRGMRLEAEIILKSLKLCDRVVAPKKLAKKLRRLQVGYKEEGRIQFDEFLDLLTFCNHSHSKTVDVTLVDATQKTNRDIYCLDDMRDVILPRDELVRRRLDREYDEEELRYEHPQLRSHVFKGNPVSLEQFQNQLDEANREHDRTRGKLKNSKRHILRSKSGYSTTDVSIRSTFKKAPSSGKKTRSTTATSATENRQIGTPSRQSSVTVATTYKSAPVVPLNLKIKTKERAHSSPPVVNDSSRRDFQTRINELQFSINTEGQRWRKYMHDEISRYIYHSDEVLERFRKPPPAPGVRRRAPRVRTQPPLHFTRRLSEPRPMLPRHHVTHCDAITHGLGDDEHAATLKRHGLRHKRAQEKKSRQNRHNDVTTQARFLERLLHNDSCDDDVSEGLEPQQVEEPDLPSKLEMSGGTGAEVGDVYGMVNLTSITDDVEHDGENVNTPLVTPPGPPSFKLASTSSWRDARRKEALDLLRGDMARVFIDCDEEQCHNKDDQVVDDLQQGDGRITRCPQSGVDIHSLITPLPKYELEESEFEKEIKKKDFTIPLDQLHDYERAGVDWLALRRSVRRIRSRSTSAKSSSTLESGMTS